MLRLLLPGPSGFSFPEGSGGWLARGVRRTWKGRRVESTGRSGKPPGDLRACSGENSYGIATGCQISSDCRGARSRSRRGRRERNTKCQRLTWSSCRPWRVAFCSASRSEFSGWISYSQSKGQPEGRASAYRDHRAWRNRRFWGSRHRAGESWLHHLSKRLYRQVLKSILWHMDP